MYVGTVVLLVLVRTKKKKVRNISYLIKKKKNPKFEKVYVDVYVLYLI